MDIESKLKEIEKSFNEFIIDISDTNYLNIPIKLAYYDLNNYTDIISELDKKRMSYKSYFEKELLLQDYIKIYISKRKIYKRLLRNIRNCTAKLLYSETLNGQEDYVYGALKHSCKFDFEKSLDYNLNLFIKLKIKQNINYISQELYILKNYPVDYTYTNKILIGQYSVLKHRNDIFCYKNAIIEASESHSFSIYYDERTSEETKNAILNILAYYNGQPYFYLTENYDFNRKLSELYEQFDLLDMLRLRNKNYFKIKYTEPIHLEIPILKTKYGYDLICLDDSLHEMIFELYHASLKQFEPLPRCVFLYRVFEYGVAHHYQKLFKPSKFSPEDAIEYYVNKIIKHKYTPLYYIDYGSYMLDDGYSSNIIKKRKVKYINFTTKLKEELKKIINEWSKHPYLKNKSIGNIIYITGRNAIAHGASAKGNAKYDYSMNYKHINDVNIFLELIARYIIDTLNPHLVNKIERRTKFYIKYNNYEKIFNREINEQ